MAGRNSTTTSVSSTSVRRFLASSAAVRALFQTWRSLRSVVGQFGEDPVDECAVDIVAAEMGIAVGGKHLEDAFLDTENRDVESAAAEVEHGDAALGGEYGAVIRSVKRYMGLGGDRDRARGSRALHLRRSDRAGGALPGG